MRYKRVLLVSPIFLQGRNRLSHFPLVGLGYIAEALKKAGICVNVFDMNLGYSFKDLQLKIAEFRPDIIGFTTMTLGYKKFYEMINKIKEIFPQIKIVVGGAHLSAVRGQVLKECLGIDYGIILEGDISMVQLCSDGESNNIHGLIYRDNGKILTNEVGNFIKDLDSLSFPKYEDFELKRYPLKHIAMATSRGCPYSCIYCSVASSIGKNFRIRSAQSVVEEIQYWYGQGYRTILIVDDNFTLLTDRAKKICELLGEKNFKDLHLKLSSGIRADRVDYNLLKILKDTGFDYIAFGVEAASDEVLRNIKKGEDIEVIEQRVKEACELGFDVDLFFLLGSPGETMQDLKKSFALAQRYPVRRAIFYNLIPFPSTELLNWLIEKDYLIQPVEDVLNNYSYYKNQPCFFTPEMSIKERKKAFKMGQKVYINVRKKFIERNLKAPLFIKKIFCSIYSRPFVEEIVVNSRVILKIKEFLKKLFVKQKI